MFVSTKSLPVAAIAITLGFAACNTTDSGKGKKPASKVVADTQQATEEAMSKQGISIKAFGNEPFWAVEVTQMDLSYSSPEDIWSADYNVVRKGDDLVFRSKGGLTLTVVDAPCSDTMADMTYPKTAVLLYRGQTLRGCATSPIPK